MLSSFQVRFLRAGIFLSVTLLGRVILEFPWKQTLRPRQPCAGGLLERDGCWTEAGGVKPRGRKRRQEDVLRNWPLLPAPGATPPGLQQSLGKCVLKLRTPSMKEEHIYPSASRFHYLRVVLRSFTCMCLGSAGCMGASHLHAREAPGQEEGGV